jgi:hypothetical protein
MQLRSISATSYQTYITCPYSFKLKYVYKLLTPENDAFVVGKALHRALENYHTGINNDIITEAIKKEFLTLPITKDKINNAGIVIKMFQVYTKYPLGGQTQSTEYEFRLPLPAINSTLHGYIDRITTDGEVIDYKTTGTDFATADANTVQAEIYKYAMEKILHKPVKIIFYVINKSKAKKPDYVPQVITVDPDTSQLVGKLGEFRNKVAADKYPPRKGKHCLWCIYRQSCKHKNNKHGDNKRKV